MLRAPKLISSRGTASHGHDRQQPKMKERNSPRSVVLLLLLLSTAIAEATSTSRLRQTLERTLKRDPDPPKQPPGQISPPTDEFPALDPPPATDVPTAVPTAVPTEQGFEEDPTSSPVAATALPSSVPTAMPRAIPTTMPTITPTTMPTKIPTGDPTLKPTKLSFVLSNAPDGIGHDGDDDGSDFDVTPNDDDQRDVLSVPLTPFRLDFVTAVSGNRRLILGHTLRGAHRTLSEQQQENLFLPAQDASLLSIVSYHLLTYFQKQRWDRPFETIDGVELRINDKSERRYDALEATSRQAADQSTDGQTSTETLSLVMVSYSFVGSVVHHADETRDRNDASLLPPADELERLTLQAFVSTEGKRSLMTALERSGDPVWRGISDVAASSEGGRAPSLRGEDPEGGRAEKLDLVFVALLATALGCTFFLAVFLGIRKYERRRRHDDRRGHHAKKKRTLTVDAADAEKWARRYEAMESPESSVMTESETPMGSAGTGSEECVGEWGGTVGRFERGVASSSADVGGGNVPCEEGVHGLPYLSQAGNIDAARYVGDIYSRGVDEETLDGLYSDKDSYFECSVTKSHYERRRQGGDSRDSFDTLNDETEQSFGWDDCAEPGVHRFEGIREVMESDNAASSSTLQRKEYHRREGDTVNDIVGDTVNGTNEDTVDEMDSSQKSETGKVREGEPANSPQKSVASAADDIYERITQLENIIAKTENQLLTQVEEASFTQERKGESFASKKAGTNAYKSIYDRPVDSSAISKNNISAGIFTEETLGMINRNRLKATPPPSEGEVDEDAIHMAKENTLLGWMVDTDSDEDSLFG